MSHTKNHGLSSWKDVLAQLRRTETTWRGHSLSPRDHHTYTEAILMCALVLVDLSNRYYGFGTRRDHVNWAHNCASVDVDHLAHFLADSILLFRSISDRAENGDIGSVADFKRQLSQKYPFAGKLLAPARCAIDEYFSYPSASTFYPVYQFLSFMTHLTLLDIDMSDELEEEYIKNEERLQQHHLPDSFVKQMNSVMVTWLRDFSVDSESFQPCHGPGTVAEYPGDRSLYSKYMALAPDALITYVLRKFASVDAQSYVPFGGGRLPTSRRSTTEFVPKSMKTKRVISKEPATLMYFEKAVESELKKFISSHKYLNKRIDLRDQSLQRDAALDASLTKEYATVDLSAASDSVSWDLVKRVFHGTALYPFLVALRSRSTVLPSGRVVEMRKFAPMGSALCFPIQTLIFACIAECTARYVHYDSGVSNFRFRVYGDDIIVPDACLSDLVIFLGWCGFRINTSKTYGGLNSFRESCGCDAYDGTDVTCMKIGRRFSSARVTSRSPSIFAGLISMANAAQEYQFPMLRQYLVDKLINGTSFVPMFSGDSRIGLYSPTPNNYRLPHRQNLDYQVLEVKASVVHTTSSSLSTLKWDDRKRRYVEGTPLPLAEDIRYFEWLRRNRFRQHLPFLERRVSFYSGSRDAFHPDFCTEVIVGSAASNVAKLWVVPESTFGPLP